MVQGSRAEAEGDTAAVQPAAASSGTAVAPCPSEAGLQQAQQQAQQVQQEQQEQQQAQQAGRAAASLDAPSGWDSEDDADDEDLELLIKYGLLRSGRPLVGAEARPAARRRWQHAASSDEDEGWQ